MRRFWAIFAIFLVGILVALYLVTASGDDLPEPSDCIPQFRSMSNGTVELVWRDRDGFIVESGCPKR